MNQKNICLIMIPLLLLSGCIQQTPEDTKATSTTNSISQTTSTTSATVPQTGGSDALTAAVGCVPISLRFQGNVLTIQADSTIVPTTKMKSVDEYSFPADIRANIVANRDDLFVYYAKSCCSTDTGYESYHYFIVASTGSKEKYMPEPEGGLLFDYSAIGGYEAYSFREAVSRDLTGSVKTWSECGRNYVLSMGWETRMDGRGFTTPAMIDRLR